MSWVGRLLNRESVINSDRKRDEIWYLDSRGQGVLNMEKALKSPAGRELLRVERERAKQAKGDMTPGV